MRISSPILFICLFLSFIILVSAAPKVKKSKMAVNRAFMLKKRECEEVKCSHMKKDYNMNCINDCISRECYERIYASEPLEPGEIDEARDKKFMDCYTDTQTIS